MGIENLTRLAQVVVAVASPAVDSEALLASTRGVDPNEKDPITLTVNSVDVYPSFQYELPPCSQEQVDTLAARYQNSTLETKQKYTYPEYVDLHYACDYDGSVQPNPDSVRRLQEEAMAQMQQQGEQPTKKAEEKYQPEKCESTTHNVSAGENVFRIGLRYDTTVDEIAKANNLTNPSLIFVDQKLVIPNQACTPESQPETANQAAQNSTPPTQQPITPTQETEENISFGDRVKEIPPAVFGALGLTVAIVGGTLVIRRKRRGY